jgi:hypothetical protein
MEPQMLRDDNGRLVKHWTMESAEALDRWRREQAETKIAAARSKTMSWRRRAARWLRGLYR